MKKKTCCVTGHRDIPVDQIDYVTMELRKAIQQAVDDRFTHFISGFAEGVDLIFAAIVAELKVKHPISLEAAIPYEGRMRKSDPTFQKLIGCCDLVKVHSEKYSKDCFMKRNRYMAERSKRVIAVWDGRNTGGTTATIKYAKHLGKEVYVTRIST